jgi:hypothetical protein
MKLIQNVIRDTATPSWLNSVPSNFGEASAGHLKADEWRTLCTVYLPLALIFAWSDGNQHYSSRSARNRCRVVLDHTMELFSAARLIFLRTMTEARCQAYRSCMIRYISRLKDVHPTAPLKASHHLSIHLYDFLKLFGPVRSWWTFPFERLIGMVTCLPHNHKFGQCASNCIL